MDLFNGMDWGAYNSFRYAANRLPELTEGMRWGSGLGSYTAVGVVLVLGVVFSPQAAHMRMAGAVIVTSLLGYVIIKGATSLTQRPRPADAENILGAGAAYTSFPSRGVFLAAFAWLMLALAFEGRLKNRAARVGVYALAAAAIVVVCVSQLWLGLHWVTDVLAGLAGGVGLALLGRWGAQIRGIRTTSSRGLESCDSPQASG